MLPDYDPFAAHVLWAVLAILYNVYVFTVVSQKCRNGKENFHLQKSIKKDIY